MNKKTTTTFLLLLLLTTIYAGDTTKLKPIKRLYAGGSLTSNLTHRYLKLNYVPSYATASEEQDIIDMRNKHEHPLFGLQAGGRLGVNIFRFFSLETGLDYNLHRYLYKSDRLFFGSDWNGGFTDTSSINRIVKLVDSYHYLNMPVAANFMFGKRKVKAVISAGVNFNFLVAKTRKFRYYEDGDLKRVSSSADYHPFVDFNLSPFLGAGIDYQIKPHMFLRIMPVAQMQALKNIDTPITEHLWSVGLNTSLFFGFLNTK